MEGHQHNDIRVEAKSPHLSHVFIAKVSAKTPAIATCDYTCNGHLGWRDRDRIITILRCTTQGGQGKYTACLLASKEGNNASRYR